MRTFGFLFSILWTATSLYADDAVVFGDAQLEAAVRIELSKPSGPLTSNDMSRLTQLQMHSAGISNLVGLESATNLNFLDLYQNEVADLTPLLQLTALETLNLSGNRITNVSGLGAHMKLSSLGLGASVSWFGVEGAGIADLSPLFGLTNLQILGVAGNHLRQIGVSNLTALTFLDVRSCRLTNICFVTNFTGLVQLALDGNLLTNVEAVASLPKLEVLTTRENLLTNIPPLHSTNLPALRWVGFEYNYVDLNRGAPGRQIIERLIAEGKHVEYGGQTYSPRLSLVFTNAPAPGATGFVEFDGDSWSQYAVEEFLDFGIGFWGWVGEAHALPLQTTRIPITLDRDNAILRLRRTEFGVLPP